MSQYGSQQQVFDNISACDEPELKSEQDQRAECERKLQQQKDAMYLLQRELTFKKEMCAELMTAELDHLEDRLTKICRALKHIHQNLD